jgi:hypothetical protein
MQQSASPSDGFEVVAVASSAGGINGLITRTS